MRFVWAGLAAALASVLFAGTGASAAAGATYGDYSLMFGRSAGQYYSGGTVAGQWWDDNGHPYGLQLDRTQYIARGLGMAFEIRQTYPSAWLADGRYYWTW